LTLDRSSSGPDHAASLDPGEFAALVAGVRTVRTALGDGRKAAVAVEQDVRSVARRALVAARDLDPDQALTSDDLIALRPSDGISPMESWDWLGRAPSRPYRSGERFSS